MLLKNEPLENRQVLLTIRVDKEDWQRALQELYNDCSSLYPVEGCAPGKATREQLEAAYGKDFLYQDAVNHTFPEALVEAVAEANLQVAAAPDLSIVDIGPGGYIFTALVQLYPEVKLGQYKGLSAPMDPAELTERDGEMCIRDRYAAHQNMDQREPARLVGPRPAGLSDPVFHHRALYQGQLLGHADLHRLSHSVHPAVHRDLRFVELPALRAGHLSDREGPGGLPPLYVDDPAHVFHRDGLLRPRPERTGSAPRRDGAAQLLYLDGAVYLLTRHEHERPVSYTHLVPSPSKSLPDTTLTP